MSWTAWLGIQGTYAEWLGLWGSVASLVSLAALPFSVYAALKIRAVGRRIAFNVGADRLLSELEEGTRSIEAGLKTQQGDLRLIELRALHCTARILSARETAFRETREYLKKLSYCQREYELSRRINDHKDRQNMQIDLLWSMLCQIQNYIAITRDMLQLKRIGATNDE